MKEEKLSGKALHQCQYEICQSEEDNRERMIHHQINVGMSHFDQVQHRFSRCLTPIVKKVPLSLI